MEAELEVYRGRFADTRLGLAREVNLGMGLIEELLKELDSTKAALKQAKFDLDNECEGRRRLQQEVQESREWMERQTRRPFAVALIDADADDYVFHDSFITKGAKGGEDAADALLAALQPYTRRVTGEPNGMDILVRAFANVGGLGAALVRDGRLSDAGQLRAFATGFSRRQAFFDFVDVGAGKERADLKVQESIKFFLESFQCKHLVLACGHDSGYAPFLGQFVGDKQAAERITLLEGRPFQVAIRDLGLKKTRFSSVFNTVTQPAVSTSLPGPAWGREGVLSTASAPHTNRGSDVGRPITIRRRVPGTPFKGYHNRQAQSDRLGPVLTDISGRRVDRPLQLDEMVVERIKKGVLCYYLYLRGECVSEKCDRNHAHRPLMDNEFDALWWLARQGKCFKSQKANRNGRNDCSDEMCVYGHRDGDM